MPRDGGEASLLTDHETSVESFRFSPDGAAIAFTLLLLTILLGLVLTKVFEDPTRKLKTRAPE